MRLSICIATFNRGAFIGETLESILAQLEPGVELVVVDGSSPDDTSTVVEGYAASYSSLHYFREASNSGIDADYDKAVGYAAGDYCWLMTDDDLLAPGAVQRVLESLRQKPDLVVVDAVVKDVDLRATLQERRLGFGGERCYGAEDSDRLMIDAGEALSFIGGTIVRRDLWLSRHRHRYHGSFFAHVGAIFQQPPLQKAIVVGEPLIEIRYGNAMWTPRRFEIWMFKWPELIWGFEGISDAAKRSAGPRHPWRVLKHLLSFRAKGAYSIAEYRRFFANVRVGWWRLVLISVAVAPGTLVHVLAVIYLRATGEIRGIGGYDLLHCSRFSNRISRALA